MKNTCGFFIYNIDTNSILLGHVTNGEHWSIPKGKQEQDESIFQAAIRELQEESNIDSRFISNCSVWKLSPQKYTHGKKRLNSFLAICDSKPKDIKCVSTFEDSYGNTLPEFDMLKWFTIDDIKAYQVPIHYTQYDSFLEAEKIIKKTNK